MTTYHDGFVQRAAESIEQEAKNAAAQGLPLDECCPYPFATPAGEQFTAVYLVHVDLSTMTPGENPHV